MTYDLPAQGPFARHFGGSPKAPPPPAQPPAVTDPSIQKAAADERTRLRNKQGRASTVLTGGLPRQDLENPPVTRATLLGGGR